MKRNSILSPKVQLRRKLSSSSSARRMGTSHTIITEEEPLLEQDPDFQEFVARVRGETASDLAAALSKRIISLNALSTELESIKDDDSQAANWSISAKRIISEVLNVQDMLGRLSLCMHLGLPSTDADRTSGFGTNIQQSLASELKVVWKACSNFSTLLIADSTSAIGQQMVEHPGIEDYSNAICHTKVDMRFMSKRFLQRVKELLFVLQDILTKNKDRFVISSPTPTHRESAFAGSL